jgi:hypothetical protein
MYKLIAVTALLYLVTSPALAFDAAKCNQHSADSCAGKGNKCSINCTHMQLSGRSALTESHFICTSYDRVMVTKELERPSNDICGTT